MLVVMMITMKLTLTMVMTITLIMMTITLMTAMTTTARLTMVLRAEGDVLRVMATRVMLVMVLMMMMTTTRTTMVLAFQDVGGEPGPAFVLRESLFSDRAGHP